jgi:hypothetical protein
VASILLIVAGAALIAVAGLRGREQAADSWRGGHNAAGAQPAALS